MVQVVWVQVPTLVIFKYIFIQNVSKMKTKSLFLALTLPMAFAACSNEEFIENNAVSANDNLIELGEGFVLTGQGMNGTTTRGIWENTGKGLVWSWLPEIVTSGGNSTLGGLSVNADRIGLCWTGELPDGTGSIGSNVYTNYEFLHNGWLAKGEEAANFNACPPIKLMNGKFYSEIDEGGLNESSNLDEIKEQLAGGTNKVELDGEQKELDLNTGIFKTENKAIFGGSYIVYYPYNEKFVDAASLPAVSPVVYDVDEVNNINARYVADNTFTVGYAQNLIGGDKTSNFILNPLSGIISLQLKQEGTPKKIAKVALWSQDGFVTSVSLDASKIKSIGAAGGEKLYVEGTKETASTIVANLKNPATLSNADYTKIYLPILPTTAKDLKVIVYTASPDGSVAIISLGKDFTFNAAQPTKIQVDMVEDDFKKDVLVAVDAASLENAVGVTAPVNVTVIGDITLEKNLEIGDKVTVEGGKIIVPEDITLTIADGGIIKSTVDVQGQPCCNGTTGGKMTVKAGATVAGNVNVLAADDETKDAGSLEFTYAAGKTSLVAATATIVSDGSIDFQGVTDIRGTLTLNAYAEVSDANSDVNVKGGTINNNGTFEVANGKFAMLNASGSTEAAEGKNFKNNGTFIDNVGTTIGGATQYMEFGPKGDYICKVNEQQRLNEAYENKTACTTIQFVNSSGVTYDLVKAIKHKDNYVNLVDAGANTIIKNSIDVKIGNLTVAAEIAAGGSTPALKVEAGKAIQVNGDIVLNGSFTTAEDVQGMTANNLIVNKDGSATFGNRDKKLSVTLAIAETIEVKEGGTFTITPADSKKNIADVTCKKLIEGGTFNGRPRVIE